MIQLQLLSPPRTAAVSSHHLRKNSRNDSMPHFVWRAVLAILDFASSEQQAAAKTPSLTFVNLFGPTTTISSSRLFSCPSPGSALTSWRA